MAPKRKTGARKAAPEAKKEEMKDIEVTAPPPAPTAEAETVDEEENGAEAEPSPKKAKVAEKTKRGRKAKASPRKKLSASSKKSAAANNDGSKKEEIDDAEEEAPTMLEAKKVIVIEASKECNCFKVRAVKVETGVTKAIPGVEVLINPEKPRKGCFEVRSKDGDIYLSLLGLPRPFTKLKNLDMDKAIGDIVAAVSG